MNQNWIVENLNNAFSTWNGKLTELWGLVTTSPQTFKGGAVWGVMQSLHNAMIGIGYALIVLFFAISLFKNTANFHELKRPEAAVHYLIRFVAAKTLVGYGMDIMLNIFSICNGVVSDMAAGMGGISQAMVTLPGEVQAAIENVGFLASIPLWLVTILGSLFITVLSFVMILTVYGRFFRLYMYTALAPLPLASFAGESTQSVGISFMRELQDDFEPPVDPNGPPSKAMLFADYLVQWLEIAKSTVKLTTYASYKELSNSRIIPYFRNLGVTLGDLKAVHIQAFYQEQLERVKPNTVIHYHAVIHRALKYAVKTDLIDVNPADKVDRPKKNEFTGNFYSKDEMNALFDAVRGSKIEVAVMLTAFYGLRRSEVVGLKWAAVDFEQNTIEICHTVTTVRLDGKEVLVESNGTKTKSSKRTLPLVPVFRERLLALQEEQKENRKLCGRCYNKKYADYICVDAMGNLLKPDYLSNSFQIILRNYHLRRIRFHDLRHSCASLLLANGVPMKMIQEWLGHSDFSTTANIYSHLDYASKVSSAEAMLNGLGMGSNPENDT